MNPISYLEIDAYLRLNRLVLEPWEVNCLVMLERTEDEIRRLDQTQPFSLGDEEDQDADGDH